MATDGVRITVTRVKDGGCIIVKETHEGYLPVKWTERHEEAMGEDDFDLVGSRVRGWVEQLLCGTPKEE